MGVLYPFGHLCADKHTHCPCLWPVALVTSLLWDGWIDRWMDADIFLRTHCQFFRIQHSCPDGCRVTVVSHSMFLLTMSFSCLKGSGLVNIVGLQDLVVFWVLTL